jgi:hypothetical protein
MDQAAEEIPHLFETKDYAKTMDQISLYISNHWFDHNSDTNRPKAVIIRVWAQIKFFGFDGAPNMTKALLLFKTAAKLGDSQSYFY